MKRPEKSRPGTAKKSATTKSTAKKAATKKTTAKKAATRTAAAKKAGAPKIDAKQGTPKHGAPTNIHSNKDQPKRGPEPRSGFPPPPKKPAGPQRER